MSLWAASPARAVLTLVAEQDGADVVIIGKGTVNIAGLVHDGDSASWTNVCTDIQMYAGYAADNNGEVGK